jgi:hypothetical protein
MNELINDIIWVPNTCVIAAGCWIQQAEQHKKKKSVVHIVTLFFGSDSLNWANNYDNNKKEQGELRIETRESVLIWGNEKRETIIFESRWWALFLMLLWVMNDTNDQYMFILINSIMSHTSLVAGSISAHSEPFYTSFIHHSTVRQLWCLIRFY